MAGPSEWPVAAARRWLGTPYVHQASCRGGGADCLGLIRGLWRERFGDEPAVPPPYTPDWDEAARQEVLWRAAARFLKAVPIAARAGGDVLLFRMRADAPAKHLGVLACSAGRETLIHAYSGHGVVETTFGLAWRRRMVAVFRFPEKV